MSLPLRLGDLITAIGTDYKTIKTMIAGSPTATLSGLTTTNKTSLVAALNEVKASVPVPGTTYIYVVSDVPYFDPAGGPGSAIITVANGHPYVEIGA